MPEVIVAEHAGLCYGVKRALLLAWEAANNHKSIFSYGELVHNPQLSDFFGTLGVRIVDSLDGLVAGDCLVIRSHGAPLQVYEECRSKNITMVDATCPKVKEAQRALVQLERDGYFPVIFGDEAHPEVRAMRSYVKHSIVISGTDDIPSLPRSPLGVISQTTQVQDMFYSVLESLPVSFVMYNTICDATRNRQDAAVELAKSVDLMLVIGGNNSSNTKKLYQLCSNIVETHQIESCEEVRPEWSSKGTIGVTAGASTPDYVLAEVVNRIKEN